MAWYRAGRSVGECGGEEGADTRTTWDEPQNHQCHKAEETDKPNSFRSKKLCVVNEFQNSF